MDPGARYVFYTGDMPAHHLCTGERESDDSVCLLLVAWYGLCFIVLHISSAAGIAQRPLSSLSTHTTDHHQPPTTTTTHTQRSWSGGRSKSSCSG